jgi:hypothetical protein
MCIPFNIEQLVTLVLSLTSTTTKKIIHESPSQHLLFMQTPPFPWHFSCLSLASTTTKHISLESPSQHLLFMQTHPLHGIFP